MFQMLWKRWVGHGLGGAALLALAGPVQAQGTLLPPTETIIRTQGPAAVPQAAPATPPLGVPVVAPPLPMPPVPIPPVPMPSVPTPAPAQQAPANIDALKAQLELQQKQIQELMNRLNALQTTSAPTSAPGDPTGAAALGAPLTPKDVQSIINGYFADQDAARKQAEKAKSDEGHRVGSDLRMVATWKNGVFMETPNKDFYVHMGGQFQYDNDFFGQSQITATKGAAASTKGYNTGDSKGGIDELVDANYFRRIRLWAEGGFWEVGEFMFQPKLEKIQNGVVGLDEMWAGVKDIPFLGTIRLGHQKTPQGLESDDYSSNRTFTYMERSSMSNAFFQNFGTGIFFTNNIAADLIGQRATYAAMFYRPQDGENGATYADGDYAFTGRLSGLPIYQKDGRCLLHLALSATYRHNRNGVATVSAQPEMYDFSGGDNSYGTATTAGATGISNINPSVNGTLGAGTSTAGNPNGANALALVSTGAITSTAETVFGSEMLFIRGPFSVQAEYSALSFIDSVGAGGNKGTTGNLTVTGGYIALSYILTGENRAYDTRMGRLATNYLETRTPFWLVRDGNGNFNYGLGAWEIEARFSHLDLNTHDINGGETDALNLGLVWHLNNNLRVTLDYLRQNRYDLPVGVNSGWLSGFGIRTQFQF